MHVVKIFCHQITYKLQIPHTSLIYTITPFKLLCQYPIDLLQIRAHLSLVKASKDLILNKSMFNSPHFEYVGKKVVDNNQLSAYYVKGATMVLMSTVDFEPLAALTITAANPECMVAVSERQSKSDSTKQRFHSIFNKDNTTFKFTITNLRSDGMIAFNIMLSDVPVTQTEPPEGICTVNELKPLKSFTIESNQHSDHATLMLSAIKDTSVRSDEAKSAALQQGLHFFLKVLPDRAKLAMCKAFEKTKWVSPDFIVLKTIARVRPRFANILNLGSYRSDSDSSDSDSSDSDEDVLILQTNRRRGPAEPAGGSLRMKSAFTPRNRGEAQCMTFLDHGREFAPPGEASQSPAPPGGASVNHARISLSTVLQEDLILDSNAVTLVAGSLRVQHTGNFTGTTYDYRRVSECSLSFSIETKMQIPANSSLNMTELSQSAIQSSIDAERDEFALKPKFQSDVCCICLDDDAGKPDAIYFSCGHIAVHKACNNALAKCPLCRQIIRAVL